MTRTAHAQEVVHEGDGALNGRLKAAGAAYDAAGLRALLAGVAAAPQGEDPDAWMALVSRTAEAGLDEPLKGQLRALRRGVPAAEMLSLAAAGPERARRLAALRAELARRGLAGFVVPHADEHMGEYLPPRAERLAWLTGFTGSAGLAIVLADKAAIFVDGRYTLQVRDQADLALFTPLHLIDEPFEDWIAANLPAGSRLGYDPWLHTAEGLKRLAKGAARAKGELVPVDANPLDAVWTDQPPPPIAPVIALEERFTGRSAADKRAAIGAKLAERDLAGAVLSAPDSIAWLLNIRGADVPRTPLPLSFAVLRADGAVDLFIDRRKLTPGLERWLGNAVVVRRPEELAGALDALGASKARVLVDSSSAAVWLQQRLRNAGAEVVEDEDPCALAKACKNAVEIAGARAAHRRDGAALTRFLAWLEGAAASGTLSEIEAAERLVAFRRQNELFRDLSFDTISGAGPNGAVIHYRVSEQTNRRLQPGELYLIDSGAQYLDGTTDVTRTVAIVGPGSAPTAEMRDRFTRVLKGHIALATVRFPKGTSGSQLDTLARGALWQAGLDYDHGTGHGVGSYLSVHEGPQRISKMPNRVALQPGMIVSNEPGYYKPGAYGIRIENLVTVVEAEGTEGAERPMLAFETLTLAPIDRRLVEPSLLTPAETAWLDAYHARVRETLTPLLDAATAAWLAAATAPIGAS